MRIWIDSGIIHGMKKTRAVRKKPINNAELPNDVEALKQLLLAAEEKL